MCSVKDGKAFVRRDKPCLVAVDIDGQMDGQDTGMGYKGPPLHTISIFANPPPYKAGHPNEVKWTKIFTWRANGDGINPFGNTLIEDCFLREKFISSMACSG